MGSLSLDRYHIYFWMILKVMLTSLSLSNPVLQYIIISSSIHRHFVSCVELMVLGQPEAGFSQEFARQNPEDL